jgi:hypothetical protein
MNHHWKDYPAAVLKAAPEHIDAALAAHYETVATDALAQAAGELGRAVALFEETPRGTLGPALRQHLNIIAAEQQSRGEVAA